MKRTGILICLLLAASDALAQSVPTGMAAVLLGVFQDIRTMTGQFVTVAWTNIRNQIVNGNIFNLVAYLYLGIYSISLYLGWIKATVFDLMTRVVFIAFVFVLVSNGTVFSTMCYQFFSNDIPNFAYSIVPWGSGNFALNTGGNTGVRGIEYALAQLWSDGIDAGALVMEETGWFDWAPAVLGLLIWLATILFVGTAMVIFAVSQIGIAVLAVLMPLFSLFLFFKPTKGLFQAWLSQLITLSLYTVIGYAVICFFIFVTQKTVNDILTVDYGTAAQTVPYFLVCVVAFALLVQVPRIASAIGAGAGITSLNMFSAIGGAALGKFTGAIGSAKQRWETARTDRLRGDQGQQVPARYNGPADRMVVGAERAYAATARFLRRNSRRN